MHERHYAGIGSRETPPDVQAWMTEIAVAMARMGWTLRSGGADGADGAFEKGAGEAKEIFLPWPRFNDNPSPHWNIPEAAFNVARQFTKRYDRSSRAVQKLFARNVQQVLGRDLRTPSKVVIAWTEGGLMKGGTSVAMRIALAHGIPVINLAKEDRSTFDYTRFQ